MNWTSMAAAGLALGGALTLAGCETMSAEQCFAGDWAGQGFRDGADGRSLGRLDDHAKACAKHGVVPDVTPYRMAREDGLLVFCTARRGFEEGSRGRGYDGVCPRDLEADFLPAYEDGREIYRAESALEDAVRAVDSREARLSELDDKIAAKREECSDEDKPEAERERACERVGELRNEVRQTRDALRSARSDLDWAEREARDVRWRLERRYR